MDNAAVINSEERGENMREKKRILSILISLCMAFTMITGTALAADTASQTETENDIEKALSNEKL